LTRAVGALAVGLAALGVAGCSASPPSQNELAQALEDSGLSAEMATCTSKAVIDNLSDEQLAELTERGAGGAPVDEPDRTDDAADKVREALTACRDTLAITTTTVTTTTTTSAPTDAGAATTTPTVVPTDDAGADSTQP